MIYYYNNYKRAYYISGLLFVVFSILNNKQILLLFEGVLNTNKIFFLALQVVIIPVASICFGFFYKKIRFVTDESSIEYISPFNTKRLSWIDIVEVERRGHYVKVKTHNNYIKYYPPLRTDVSNKNIFNMLNVDNMLQEIHSKAKNARFINF